VEVRVRERGQEQRVLVAEHAFAVRPLAGAERLARGDAAGFETQAAGCVRLEPPVARDERPADDVRRTQSDDGSGFASLSFISAPQHAMLPPPALLHSASALHFSQM